MLKYWKWQDIFAAIVMTVGGFVILTKPKLTLELMTRAVGVLLMIVGLIFMLAYLVRKKSKTIGYDLVLGVVILGLGIFVFITPGFVETILPVIFSICIVISGILKLQRGLDLKRLRAVSWGYIIILALGSILLGTIILLNPIKVQVWVLRIIALSFIYSGITDLITAVYVSWKYSRFVVKGSADEPKVTLEKTTDYERIDGYYDEPSVAEKAGINPKDLEVNYDKEDEERKSILDSCKAEGNKEN